MTEHRSRTSLTPHAARMQEPDVDRAWEECRQAWHNHGLVCISLEQAGTRLGWAARKSLELLGEQAFGKRTDR